MPERRTPWIAIDVDIRKDDRVVDLPSDAARYGYVAGVLAEARLQSPRGVYGSRATLAEAIGRFDRFTPHYLEVGLLEQGSALCADCREAYGGVPAKALVVHNWYRKNPDHEGMPKEVSTPAERTAMWRLRTAVFERDHWTCRYCGKGEYPRGWLVAEHVIPDGPSTMENLVAACRPCNKRKGNRTPAQAGMPLLPEPPSDSHGDDNGDSHGDSHGDKRDTSPHARAPRHQTQTLDTTEGIPSSGVTPREATSPARAVVLGIEPDDVRHPVAAILADRYRWTQVTDAQWAQLAEEVDNEYPAGTARGRNPADGWLWLSGWLAELPRDAGEPIGALFARQQRVKADRLAANAERIEESEKHKRARLHPSLGGAG